MDDQDQFFPNYVLPSTRAATQDEITRFKQFFDKSLEKLLSQTKDFYERMMLSKGVFYTRNEGAIYFHDVYGINFDKREVLYGGVFLAYYPNEKGVEFGIEADAILHLHLFSDSLLNEKMNKLNEEKNNEVGQGLTHFYFTKDTAQFIKTALAPDSLEDNRKSLVEKNKAFKLYLSEIMIEDLEILERYMKLLLRKMKKTKTSRELA